MVITAACSEYCLVVISWILCLNGVRKDRRGLFCGRQGRPVPKWSRSNFRTAGSGADKCVHVGRWEPWMVLFVFRRCSRFRDSCRDISCLDTEERAREL